MSDIELKQVLCKSVFVSTIIIWKNIFGQSRFTQVLKMQKFATVSSQICIMRYVQRSLFLSTLVCFCSICGPYFMENIQKES